MAPTKALKERASRRQLPRAEKRRIVDLMLRSGASVVAIAREHGLNPNRLYRWKRLYGAGELDAQRRPLQRATGGAGSASFVPVSLVPAVLSPQATTYRDTTASVSSIIQLAFVSGATLRIEAGSLDAALLCALVAELRR